MDRSDTSSSNKYRYEPGSVTRLEVLAGPTGRRRWPDDVKARIVAESFAGDRPISEVARSNGLVPSQLFAWRRRARDGRLALPVDEDAAFAPLLIEADAASSASAMPKEVPAGTIAIETDGVILRLAADTPAPRIAEIVRALKSPP